MKTSLYSIFSLLIVILLLFTVYPSSIGQAKKVDKIPNLHQGTEQTGDTPFINDPNLKSEVVADGLSLPTSMAFLSPNDILVLEKDKGTVRMITNGKVITEPILDANVATFDTQGMLGIAVQKNMSTSQDGNHNESTYVFIYFTRADKDNYKAIDNVLYRYELVNRTLVTPKLLLDLPAGKHHSGGKILVAPDKNVYITIGELDTGRSLLNEKSKALNNQSKYAIEPDGRGGILRIDQNGQPIGAHDNSRDCEIILNRI